jgi:hypothetical protein
MPEAARWAEDSKGRAAHRPVVLGSRRLLKTLSHFPDEKREQVEVAKALILARAKEQMELLVLFGSHTRVDWAEDLNSGYLSDMDFLIGVEWSEQLKGDHWALLQ